MSAQASYIADAAAERKRTVDDMNMMEGVEGVDAMGHQYSQDSPIKKRQMEKQQYSKVYGQKALELLQVTDENFQLASEVFDCLDIDKNQRLEKDDFNGGSEVRGHANKPPGSRDSNEATKTNRALPKRW
eukprot:SAG31_NODE_225_length_19846_cov_19.057983_12_plen_130_part_00